MRLFLRINFLVLPLIFGAFLLLTKWETGSSWILANRLNVKTVMEAQDQEVIDIDCHDFAYRGADSTKNITITSRSSAVYANALAWRYWLVGQCLPALHLWYHANESSSARPIGYFWAGVAHVMVGDDSGATTWFQKAEAGRWLLEQGSASLNDNDALAAMRWLELSRDVAPTRPSLQLLVSLYRDDPDRVVSIWHDWSDRHLPAEIEYWYGLGAAAAVQQDWPAAADYYSRGAALENADLSIIRQAQIAAAQAGQVDLEAAMITRGIELSPDSVPPLLDAANFHLKYSQLDEAVYYVEQAIDLDKEGDNWRVFHTHGRIQCAQNNLDRAVVELTQAKALSNHNLFVSRDLAWCYWEQGQYELALLEIEEARTHSVHIQKEPLLGAALLDMSTRCLREDNLICARIFLEAAQDFPSVAEQAADLLLQNNLRD